eukprot:1112228-Pyramimonas_sp.AAC.2
MLETPAPATASTSSTSEETHFPRWQVRERLTKVLASVKAIREEASQITELPSSTPTESEEPQGVNSRTQGVTSQAGPSKAVNREADLSALCEEVTHEPCAILLTPLNVS